MPNENDLACSIMISNMSCELFNDALYYREMADKNEDFYIKWRYRRSSIISFCASTESWMNCIIKDNLEKRMKPLNNNEKELLDFIKDYKSKMPNGFNNVRNKLYNFIPECINKTGINWKSAPEESFENYIELSNMRNSVIHYAVRNSKDVHSEKFVELIKQSPDIIENLFKTYALMGNKLSIPSWYKDRYSRIIK
ncbi:hypothetical protein AGR56_04170 [Clostridium sp. DMHC 10]|uniref:hypothetical protein n=1 Tax=Clostridium sp. DMHC 10 TaxID=747377 RepID=UPI00069D27E9|nr:hypothetical protein [Clostridium sp. DMHC 10]KOF56124.1 hypothetical protein AGR56_04170 [Clostridium sp. DMHC 10]